MVCNVHELGHDVFNFDHGQGSKMMFNFSWRNKSIDEFISDREKMFEIYFRKNNNSFASRLNSRLNSNYQESSLTNNQSSFKEEQSKKGGKFVN